MKIGILTFHASHNYGSMFQTYALQHVLIQQGHDVEVINLRIKEQKKIFRFPLFPPLYFRKNWLNRLFNPILLYHACRKWWKFESFLKENFRLTDKEYEHWEEIVADLSRLNYQCIITGGDQIWNLHCMDFTKAYYLPSELPNIRKISYAPSFGDLLNVITREEEQFLKKNLSSYDYISVRETSMQLYLRKLLEREIDVVADPVLLLDRSDYEKFIDKEPIVKGDYILYYSPCFNNSFRVEEKEKLALKLGRYHGMKVVTSYPCIYDNGGMYSVAGAGPAEFLNLLKNAKLIVGKSFHLIVFSLLFHKNFIAIDGDIDPRMKSFLEMMHVPECGKATEENLKDLPKIDFDYIDSQISNLRLHSEAFLKRALTSDV